MSVRIDQLGDSGLSVTLDAFDLDGALIDSFTTLDLSGATLEVSGPGIHSVRFFDTNDVAGAGLDDCAFNAAAPVPEPSTASLLFLSLAMLVATRPRNS